MTLVAEIMDTVQLSGLLTSITQYIRRYVVVSADQAIAIALWVAHTHVIAAADCTPYLQITSATKRAGKTRLLEVLEPLVARPWFTCRTSAAALARKVDAESPTLLLDESDATFKGDKEYAETLRGILNSGYRRSGKTTVCIGQGANLSFRDFSTFCPKAIAGIGALPDTVADRSIQIALQRRRSDEPCSRWRSRDGHVEAQPLFVRLDAWARSAITALRDARPDIPTALNDRAVDVWEPLLAIADQAGGDWPMGARSASVALMATVEESDILIELLSDIRQAWTDLMADLDGHPKRLISSKALLAELNAREDRPWATWRNDRPMTQKSLAKLLKLLVIRPVSDGTQRGYRQDAFADAFARYLPSEASMRQKVNEMADQQPISTCQMPGAIDTSVHAGNADEHAGSDALTLARGGKRDGERF